MIEDWRTTIFDCRSAINFKNQHSTIKNLKSKGTKNKNDLEERLINFSVMIIRIADNTPLTLAGKYLANQITRSGTSPALNYGEAQAGESRKDFVHKMKICLKELRETFINLKILEKAKLFKSKDEIDVAIAENSDLISIFVKNILIQKKNKGM